MNNLDLPPTSRVSNAKARQSLFNWIISAKLPLFISTGLLVTIEVAATLVNKLNGSFSKPEDYLNSLVEYNRSLNQGQKVAIVTGANSGIGFVTADYLYRAGYYVILACRNEQKAKDAIEKIQLNESDGQLEFIKFDANSLESVKEFVQQFEKLNLKLDLLINNAGIMMAPYEQTENFVESQIGTNFLSHYFLTDLLISHLNSDAKIINLSSLASFLVREFDINQITNKDKYSKIGNYSQSKLAMTMFAYHLKNKLQSNNVTVYSVHPGMVSTNLYNLDSMAKLSALLGKLTFKNALVGAFTTLRCALLPPAKDHGEKSLYYVDEAPFIPPTSACNEQALDELIRWAKETILASGFELRSNL